MKQPLCGSFILKMDCPKLKRSHSMDAFRPQFHTLEDCRPLECFKPSQVPATEKDSRDTPPPAAAFKRADEAGCSGRMDMRREMDSLSRLRSRVDVLSQPLLSLLEKGSDMDIMDLYSSP